MKVKSTLTSYLLLLTLVLTNFSVLTLARYITSAYGQASARVALFQNSTSVSIKDIKGKPGDVTIIPIYITNFDENKISEVTSNFTVNVSRDYGKNIPLKFSLYKDKECTMVVYRDENENFFDDTFTLKGLQKEAKTLYLKIEWPSDENNYQNAFEIDYLTINFRVYQVD